jgi:hypothetical protein
MVTDLHFVWDEVNFGSGLIFILHENVSDGFAIGTYFFDLVIYLGLFLLTSMIIWLIITALSIYSIM